MLSASRPAPLRRDPRPDGLEDRALPSLFSGDHNGNGNTVAIRNLSGGFISLFSGDHKVNNNSNTVLKGNGNG